MDCIFCKIINREIANTDIIYEDDKVLVMLDIDNVVKGHTLLIWKEHHENLSEMSEEEYLYFSKIIHKTEKKLLELCKCNKSIILKTGGIVSHFHFHIYPTQKTITWEETKGLFEKQCKYEYKPNEKETLINELNKYLQNK